MMYSTTINDKKTIYWSDLDSNKMHFAIIGKGISEESTINYGSYILELKLKNILMPKFILTSPTGNVKEFRVTESIIARVIAYIMECEEPKWRE